MRHVAGVLDGRAGLAERGRDRYHRGCERPADERHDPPHRSRVFDFEGRRTDLRHHRLHRLHQRLCRQRRLQDHDERHPHLRFRFQRDRSGVFATEWTSSAISVFFFPRGSMLADLARGSPDPASWGEPLARFQGDCDMATSFRHLRIIFDTTSCGDWAGEVWSGSTCASTTQQTCEDFVADHPHAFVDAYWSVNSLEVYQVNASSPRSSLSKPSCASTDPGCHAARSNPFAAAYTNTPLAASPPRSLDTNRGTHIAGGIAHTTGSGAVPTRHSSLPQGFEERYSPPFRGPIVEDLSGRQSTRLTSQSDNLLPTCNVHRDAI